MSAATNCLHRARTRAIALGHSTLAAAIAAGLARLGRPADEAQVRRIRDNIRRGLGATISLLEVCAVLDIPLAEVGAYWLSTDAEWAARYMLTPGPGNPPTPPGR